MSVRVLIADDHRLFAEAVRAMLSTDERIEVVGLAESGDEAVTQADDLEPDVVLMDISMPGLNGVEATRRIVATRPDARVLMVTGSDAQEDVEAARTAGASGYMTKDKIAAELVVRDPRRRRLSDGPRGVCPGRNGRNLPRRSHAATMQGWSSSSLFSRCCSRSR